MESVFEADGPQDPEAIGEGIEIAPAVDTARLVAAHFADDQATARHSHVDDRLDLEAVTPPLGVRSRR